MPKLRMTEQQRREQALDEAVAVGKVRIGARSDQDLADRLCMDPRTFRSRKRRGLADSFGVNDTGHLLRTLKCTGREACRILGIRYEDPE